MSQWSVSVIHHLTTNSGARIEVPQASYGIDHDRVAEATQNIHDAAAGDGGSRRAFAANVVPQTDPYSGAIKRDQSGRQVASGHREIRVYTPEGHQVHFAHVDDLLNGRRTADDVRSETARVVFSNKQREYEGRIDRAMAAGGLPHSGVDAMLMGVPTASSTEGAAITAGHGKPGFVYPRHDAPVPDRASSAARVLPRR